MVGFLIEHFAGSFPVWLSPVQIVIIPVSEKYGRYGEDVKKRLEEKNLRVELDDRDETMQAKIRDAQLQKVPYMLVVGEKEQKAKGVALRLRDGRDLGLKKLDQFVEKADKKIVERDLKIW